MHAGGLIEIAVTTLIEAEAEVAELVERVLRQTPVLYTDEATLVTRVSVYRRLPAGLSAAERGALVAGLRRLRARGCTVGPTRLHTRCLPPRDWAESWKRHFRPLTVGSALLIKPSWSRRRPARGQVVVVLDPGLSFGTGQHPTTHFCLRQLVACRAAGRAASVLDIGTGSGILAIAAVKLGYQPVEAFDFDPIAVRVARENARQNGVASMIRLARRDLTRLSRRGQPRYDVVCANLLAELLIAERARILSRLQPGGRLVVAGVLVPQFAAVQEAYEADGLRLRRALSVQGWRSGLFSR